MRESSSTLVLNPEFLLSYVFLSVNLVSEEEKLEGKREMAVLKSSFALYFIVIAVIHAADRGEAASPPPPPFPKTPPSLGKTPPLLAKTPPPFPKNNVKGMTANSSSSAKTNIPSKFNVCRIFPSEVNSEGFWVKKDSTGWWLNNTLPVLELQMILFFFSTQASYFGLKRFGIPKFASQLIIGLAFGFSWKKFNAIKVPIFNDRSQELLGLLTTFGYALFLFITAVKMDMTMTLRNGGKATAIGILALLVPLMSGVGTMFFVHKGLTRPEIEELSFLIAAYSLSSFPVISALISELKLVNSELGRLGLSSAIVGEFLLQFLLLLAHILRIWKMARTKAYMDIISIAAFFLLLIFAVRPAMLWIIRQTPEGKPVKNGHIHIIIIIVMASSVLSSLFDQYALFGPYMVGLFTPDGPPLGSTIVDKMECFVSDILLPIFVTTSAMRADLKEMVHDFSTKMMKPQVLVAFVILVAKILTCLAAALYSKLPFKDSLALALIMSTKGVVDLAIFTFNRDLNVIEDGAHAFATIFILFISIIVPTTVRLLYDPSRKYAGYQNRNIMHLKPNSELRILVCIHRNDNAIPVIRLLNVSCPTEESPLAIYVLHLIELIGRSSPIFISHKMQKKTINSESCSEHLIHSFSQLEREQRGAVYVEPYTAISPHKLLHEDICTLALNKLTSLIILPFHRTWKRDGTVKLDDNSVRNLNCSVLKRAPCSVAIFVDRGQSGRSAVTLSSRSSEYSVCVIFIGGKDDREAMTYAKRMAIEDSKVNLTVLRLLSIGDSGLSDWDKMLDSLVLKQVEMNLSREGLLIYREHTVKDGPETALLVRSIVNDYDLIIVGRRDRMPSAQTAGLTEWSEFPEIGVIGDLLASPDLQSKTSVLIMQQQLQAAKSQ